MPERLVRACAQPLINRCEVRPVSRIAARYRAPRGQQEGQGLVEYALMLMLIAIVAISALLFLGSNLSSTLSSVANSVGNAPCVGASCPRNWREEDD